MMKKRTPKSLRLTLTALKFLEYTEYKVQSKILKVFIASRKFFIKKQEWNFCKENLMR